MSIYQDTTIYVMYEEAITVYKEMILIHIDEEETTVYDDTHHLEIMSKQ